MNVKIAVVVLLAVFTTSQAYFVLNTWADENCNTTLVARYFTSDSTPCLRKRAAAQAEGECEVDNIGVYYTTDLSYCESATEPEFPAGWQSVRFGGDPTCNYTSLDAEYSAIGVNSAETIPIAIFYLHVGNVAINTTMSCANTGVLSVSICVSAPCQDFSLPNGTCFADASNGTFALQNSCASVPAPPQSTAPTVAPIANTPTSSVPVQTPATVPSNASASEMIHVCLCALFSAFICVI